MAAFFSFCRVEAKCAAKTQRTYMHFFLVVYVAGIVVSWAPIDNEGKCQAAAREMTDQAEAFEGATISVKCEDRNDPPAEGEQNV